MSYMVFLPRKRYERIEKEFVAAKMDLQVGSGLLFRCLWFFVLFRHYIKHICSLFLHMTLYQWRWTSDIPPPVISKEECK